MSTTVKAGWLKDKDGNKFAPKTMSSQIINDDGGLFKDNIEMRLDEISIQSDWNQSDSTKLDFIKNRPFYEKFTEVELINETLDFASAESYNNMYYIEDFTSNYLEEGVDYVVYWDGVQYECVGMDEGNGYIYLGNQSIALDWEFQNPISSNEPFFIATHSDYMHTIVMTLNASSHTMKIVGNIPEITQLDRKFIADHLEPLAGLKVKGKVFPIDDVQTTARNGAEIFNDYNTNIAVGKYSHAEGSNTIVSGDYSHAEGYDTNASGMVSHAEGYKTTASGSYAHAEGYETIASEMYSHAEGWLAEATGKGSHAEGFATHADGQFSHAEGDNATATGRASHAEGYSTDAVADYSHAEGMGAKASSRFQHVQGKYNIEDAEDKYAHIVGNGTGNYDRSNIHTLDWSGNAWFASDVYVGGTGQDDASKLMTEADMSWNKIQNKPFEMTEGLQSDTIAWDGNISGKIVVADIFVHVSDATPSYSDFSDGCSITVDSPYIEEGTPLPFAQSDVIDYGTCIIPNSEPFFIITLADNTELEGAVFPKKGVYFFFIEGEIVTTSLTINGYTEFATEKLKESAIPDNISVNTLTIGNALFSYDSENQRLVISVS